MSDLKSVAILQARVYEFLAQQDEATLQAIVGGSMQLAVLQADGAWSSAASVPHEDLRIGPDATPTGHAMAPSSDPLQAAWDISRLTSEQDRRIYLKAAGMRVEELRRIANLLGYSGYSKLRRPEVESLLVGHNLDKTKAPPDEPRPPTPSSSHPAGADSAGRRTAAGGAATAGQEHDPVAPRGTVEEAGQSTIVPSAETAQPSTDVSAIAARLRKTETEEDGAAYLRAQRLDRDSLLAVAAELQLTRVDRLSQTELEKRVLRQAIGARRKFDGLRRW